MPNILSLSHFLPELVLGLTALILLCYAVLPKNFVMQLCSFAVLPLTAKRQNSTTAQPQNNYSSYIALAGLLLSLFFTFNQWNIGNPPLFWGLLTLDKPAIFFKAIFLMTAGIVVIFSQKSREVVSRWPLAVSKKVANDQRPMTNDSSDQRPTTNDSPEYYSLLTASVLGMMLLAQASNLLMIYLALEFISLLSFILVGYTKDSLRSSEAALKYVLYGAVASGIFLYGASLYYGQTGTLDIAAFTSNVPRPTPFVSLTGLFMLAGFLYKIAAVPMHAWCPDAYEGAPTPITAFLSVAPKAAGFAVLLRVAGILSSEMNWPFALAVISAVTMSFGNLVAIAQNNVKRLLAYSSIAHAGYLLMGVACMTPKGSEAVYFYFVAYIIMNLGAFLVVQIVAESASLRGRKPEAIPIVHGIASPPAASRNDSSIEHIDTYKGLASRGAFGAVIAIAMTIFLLSLTGVPPFIGFIGKFYIFSAVIEAKLYWLAFIGIANSVVSLYYYMRIVKVMFFDAPQEGAVAVTVSSKRLAVTMATLASLTVIFGLYWQWLSALLISFQTANVYPHIF